MNEEFFLSQMKILYESSKTCICIFFKLILFLFWKKEKLLDKFQDFSILSILDRLNHSFNLKFKNYFLQKYGLALNSMHY